MIAGAMKGVTLATTAGECLRDAISSIAKIIMKHSSPHRSLYEYRYPRNGPRVLTLNSSVSREMFSYLYLPEACTQLACFVDREFF